jgi:DNA-binding transcriptional MerR regulator
LYFGGKKVIKEKAIFEELDTEWMTLILEALEIGLNTDEIREFLNNKGRAVGQQN